MLKYLLPFGKTITGILLNVAMYSILLFIVIYLPIYFSMNTAPSPKEAVASLIARSI